LSRQHLKALVRYTVTADAQAVPVLHYEVSTAALDRLSNNYLGKTMRLSFSDPGLLW
jgi:hypothetical protein